MWLPKLPTDEGVLQAFALPLQVQLGQALLHLEGHAHAGQRILLGPARFGVAEEDHHRVADELVDGAAMPARDLGHFREISVDVVGQHFGLHHRGDAREALDVGEEDREQLALGLDLAGLLAGENGLVDLLGQVARKLLRQALELALFDFELFRDVLQPRLVLVADADDASEVFLQARVLAGQTAKDLGADGLGLLRQQRLALAQDFQFLVQRGLPGERRWRSLRRSRAKTARSAALRKIPRPVPACCRRPRRSAIRPAAGCRRRPTLRSPRTGPSAPWPRSC